MTRMAIPTIETERLVLRPPSVDDFAGYASIVTTDRGQFVGGPFDKETAWLDYSQMVAGWVFRGFGALTVATRDTGEYLGTVLVHHEFGDPEPELGWLFTAAAEGHGYAFEAGRAMLDWAFANTGLRSLVSYMDPRNERALALATRLGGRPAGDPSTVPTYSSDVVTYRYDAP